MNSSRGMTVVGMAAVVFVTVFGALACETRDTLIADPGGSSSTASTTPTAGPATPAPSSPDAAAATPPPADQAQINQDMMARWNQAADNTPSAFAFHWNALDQFPHPTFMGGSNEAYQAFAQVLLAFLQTSFPISFQGGVQNESNFDFLGRNHLFETRLRYVFPSGQVGIDTSFKELAIYLASATTFPSIPQATKSTLQAFVDRMGP